MVRFMDAKIQIKNEDMKELAKYDAKHINLVRQFAEVGKKM